MGTSSILSVPPQHFQVLIGFLDVENIYKFIILLPTPNLPNNAFIACLIIYISLRYWYLIMSACQMQLAVLCVSSYDCYGENIKKNSDRIFFFLLSFSDVPRQRNVKHGESSTAHKPVWALLGSG